MKICRRAGAASRNALYLFRRFFAGAPGLNQRPKPRVTAGKGSHYGTPSMETPGSQIGEAQVRDRSEITIAVVGGNTVAGHALSLLLKGAGYVLKDAPAERLINAVHRTLDGESPLNQELATRLLRQLAEEKQHNQYRAQSKRHEPLDDALTPRETEVLGLLTTGQTNQQIAQTLTISKGTAKVHVERIIRKLGVSDRTQAAVRAIELGFTSLETRQ
jgi:DNA-binding NarL/FixJ family response regulator